MPEDTFMGFGEGEETRNPFATPPDQRDPFRRFRGRLTSPVTIVTAGEGPAAAGLTVSSLVVAEGAPSLVYLLIGSTSDLFERVVDTGRFVVHVCERRHRRIADVFAGLRPNPGGVFAGAPTTPSAYGPVLDDFPTRAFCSLREHREESYSVLITSVVDRVEVGELTEPLVYFRGGYEQLS